VEVAELGVEGREPMTVSDLQSFAANSTVDVTAYPRATGELVGGIILAGGGGVMLMAGLMALFVGSAKDSPAAQVAGGITAGLGAAAIAPGVILIVGHREYLEVTLSAEADLSLGPGYLRGSF